jgi:hypothetical protein
MRHNFRSALLLVLLAGSATACATAGTGEAVSSTSRSSPITLAEIRQSSASNALELVQALRPNWLRARGQTSIRYGDEVVVYLNNIRLGTIESLREISTTNVGSVEYVEPRLANMRWGAGHTQGAIVVNNRT